MRVRWFFLLFVVSGFCSLVYQVVWLRLAMASFGVTAALVSIVVSVFMAGLAVGSWLAGGLLRRAPGVSPLRLYSLTELLIGSSGVLAPQGILQARHWLAARAQDVTWGSLGHHLAAAIWLAAILAPFCVAMGATLPLGMAAVRRFSPDAADHSFSYLYLANVCGAFLGTLSCGFVLVETFGFKRTLLLAAALNVAIASAAALLGRRAGDVRQEAPVATRASGSRLGLGTPGFLLFATGFASMGMEVVWVRQYTPYVGTVVYAFATILAIYLAATFAGSTLYRHAVTRGVQHRLELLWLWAAPLSLLPLLATDPRLPLSLNFVSGVERLALGLGPFCALLGYLTPLLVDRWSQGRPDTAGRLYALNVLGCIIGPLAAGFVLLPGIGERGALVALSLALFAAAAAAEIGWRSLAASATLSLPLAAATHDYSTLFERPIVRRDYTATVIAAGKGSRKRLLVNGMGMTSLSPTTKMIAHLPLAHLSHPAENGLVLCFGMGTTFRSLRSWGIRATAVELVPSVVSLFPYYHPDASTYLDPEYGRVVVDDGRRFLERSRERYDVILVDPPPPVEAAGSSLLYTREFYSVARERLSPDGILQQWLPGGDRWVVASVTRALLESFTCVRAFPSLFKGGIHFLASQTPIPPVTAAEAAKRLPPAAARDCLEWGPEAGVEQQFERMLGREIPIRRLLRRAPTAPALEDDQPLNEYYFLRRLADGSLSSLTVTRLATFAHEARR